MSQCQQKAKVTLIVLLATNGHVLAHGGVSLTRHGCHPVSENYSKEKCELVSALGGSVLEMTNGDFKWQNPNITALQEGTRSVGR